MSNKTLSAIDSLTRLKNGNEIYLKSKQNDSDISPELRQGLFEDGQFPYAVVITCSDSRVVPEHIFNCGLGELFVVRVAGNVIADTQIASTVYASAHLGSKLILVLGHTHCGAIDATINGGAHGCVSQLTNEIAKAIGDEKNDYKACKLNVEEGVKRLLEHPEVHELVSSEDVEVVGGIYNINTGIVDFL